MLKRLGEDAGTIALVLSVIAIMAGIKSGNMLVTGLGVYGFVKIVNSICDFVKRKSIADYNTNEAKAYCIKRQADSRAELVTKAYKDGKVSDEDISFLVRSLATNVSTQQAINTNISKPVAIQPINAIEVKPVVTEEIVVDNATEQVEVEDNNDEQIIPYTIESGRFVFKYKNKDMAFGPSNVVKNAYLQEEFNDSAGYYKNADAVFYIYPSEKKLIAVEI